VKALRLLAQRLGVTAEYLETGTDLGDQARREWRLSEAELELRLGDDPRAVERELQGLLAEARQVDDEASVLRALTGLGFAAAHDGRHRETIELLEQVVTGAAISPATHPDVYATLARSYATVGPERKAVDLFERCLVELREREPEDVAAYVRFATYLSYALSDVGDLPRARAVLDEALAHVDDATDPYSRVRVYWSQARLADIEGNHAQAQAHIRRAIALLDLTEDTLHLARAHLLYAESTLAEGRPDKSTSLLATAERLFGSRPETKDRVWLLVLQGQRSLLVGDAAGAADSAREALKWVGEDDPELRGRVETVLGRALSSLGNRAEALEAFERARSLLSSGDHRYLIQLLDHWSSVLEEEGKLAEALSLARRASRLATGRLQPDEDGSAAALTSRSL
jgi:tetratricopeptide (TPR) repeat protein